MISVVRGLTVTYSPMRPTLPTFPCTTSRPTSGATHVGKLSPALAIPPRPATAACRTTAAHYSQEAAARCARAYCWKPWPVLVHLPGCTDFYAWLRRPSCQGYVSHARLLCGLRQQQRQKVESSAVACHLRPFVRSAPKRRQICPVLVAAPQKWSPSAPAAGCRSPIRRTTPTGSSRVST